ncbi:MAG: glycosyl hydrolase-related protein, partial [Armatimonadota bacterium]
GELPPEMSLVEVLTPNVFLSALKKAEGSDAVVLRMFEAQGKKTTARVRLAGIVKPGAAAVETDILEQPLAKNGAKLDGDILTVTIPAYGIATVKIG